MTFAASGFAWVDGVISPRDEARVSIDDFAVRYGAACFETMLARNGIVFRLADHLDRLNAGLRAMGVEVPPFEVLAGAIDETLAANWLPDASVRITVTPGRGHAPDLAEAGGASVIITVDELPPRPLARRLRVVSVRLDAGRVLPGAKTAQFLPYLLARAEARATGADDALLLNHDGAVVEAATANVFALLGGTLVTPPLADGPLPGITRRAVLEVAASIGLLTAERRITLDDLAAAEAILLTSSVTGIVGVASVEAAPPEAPVALSWEAPGVPRVVAELAEAYETLVDRSCDPEG